MQPAFNPNAPKKAVNLRINNDLLIQAKALHSNLIVIEYIVAKHHLELSILPVVEVLDDGQERLFPDPPMRFMTDEEISAAAQADLDARTMTEQELKTARRVPCVKTMRRALGVTQEEFA